MKNSRNLIIAIFSVAASTSLFAQQPARQPAAENQQRFATEQLGSTQANDPDKLTVFNLFSGIAADPRTPQSVAHVLKDQAADAKNRPVGQLRAMYPTIFSPSGDRVRFTVNAPSADRGGKNAVILVDRESIEKARNGQVNRFNFQILDVNGREFREEQISSITPSNGQVPSGAYKVEGQTAPLNVGYSQGGPVVAPGVR